MSIIQDLLRLEYSMLTAGWEYGMVLLRLTASMTLLIAFPAGRFGGGFAARLVLLSDSTMSLCEMLCTRISSRCPSAADPTDAAAALGGVWPATLTPS